VVVVCSALVGSKTDKGLLYVLVFSGFASGRFSPFLTKADV